MESYLVGQQVPCYQQLRSAGWILTQKYPPLPPEASRAFLSPYLPSWAEGLDAMLENPGQLPEPTGCIGSPGP